jgi:hypothetical protein
MVTNEKITNMKTGETEKVMKSSLIKQLPH